jgi:hypothetical protein
MVVAEVLDFPGVFSQGFDLPDARSMVASALVDVAKCTWNKDAHFRFRTQTHPRPMRI